MIIEPKPRIRAVAMVGLGLALAGCREEPGAVRRVAPPLRPPVRITMDALHRAGGVPLRWKFTPPPGDVAAGREAFQQLGCPSCHFVKGEPFSVETTTGPALTGMGAHHPAEYFAEAIMNPDAVLIEGPGYIDADGRSTMPAYPDMTLAQVADLVAYVKSLTDDAQQPGQRPPPHPMGAPPASPALPAAPQGDASSFFVQTYEVREGALGEFEAWFAREGAQQFLASDGLLSVDTYVDGTGENPVLVTVFGFRSDGARERFLEDRTPETPTARFADFITPQANRSFRRPPLYRAPSLSTP